MMGKVIMSGIVPQLVAPSAGILASDLAVGSTVKLMENGSAVEYLVVHSGKPSTSYDTSCDGLWLLRKDIYETREWNSAAYNAYEDSAIHSYLNEGFFDLLGSVEQGAIKQVKIPYREGGGSSGSQKTGSNGLSCKVFLISIYEAGWTSSTAHTYASNEGANLDYFSGGGTSERIANYNGSAANWWTRSVYTNDTKKAWRIGTTGGCSGETCTASYGIRPALILPSTAVFDEETLILKGVA